jgi:hypothetical protein
MIKGKLQPLKLKDLIGKHGDGNGLWLVKTGPGMSGSWIKKYQRNGISHEMGLGRLDAVSLSLARELSHEADVKLARGIDPLEEKREARRKAIANQRTFEVAAEAFMADKESGWTEGNKHSWRQGLEDHAYPVIGNMLLSHITREDAANLLRPIWTTKTTTAARIRFRCANVWGYGKTFGWCTGDNPFAWEDNLENIFSPPSDVAPPKPHAALDWEKMPQFMRELRGLGPDFRGALGLEFVALTAVRVGTTRCGTFLARTRSRGNRCAYRYPIPRWRFCMH